MEKIMRLLPILLMILAFQALHTSNSLNSQLSSTMVSAAYRERDVTSEAANNLSGNEAIMTIIIVSCVVLFLISMYIVRRKIKKAINEKAELK
jgi:hypothetical protein